MRTPTGPGVVGGETPKLTSPAPKPAEPVEYASLKNSAPLYTPSAPDQRRLVTPRQPED